MGVRGCVGRRCSRARFQHVGEVWVGGRGRGVGVEGCRGAGASAVHGCAGVQVVGCRGVGGSRGVGVGGAGVEVRV